jgi:two-component system sensor histidine kinase TctE
LIDEIHKHHRVVHHNAREGDRALFRALLKVSGVGGKMALGILSGMTPEEFSRAVQAGDLAALTREVAREWTPKAVAAGIDLGYEGAEKREIEGDALQLREAMSNLIDNALRYTPKGSTVTLKVEPHGAMTHLVVEDNGPGLGADELPHVFQRFWRASDQPGGCGLGLAIVREIARRHGGDARVERVLPQGLRVVLALG